MTGRLFGNTTASPLSVPQSALWPNALMIRPYSTPARGLLGAPWQDSALSAWHLLGNNGPPVGGSQWGEPGPGVRTIRLGDSGIA